MVVIPKDVSLINNSQNTSGKPAFLPETVSDLADPAGGSPVPLSSPPERARPADRQEL